MAKLQISLKFHEVTKMFGGARCGFCSNSSIGGTMAALKTLAASIKILRSYTGCGVYAQYLRNIAHLCMFGRSLSNFR